MGASRSKDCASQSTSERKERKKKKNLYADNGMKEVTKAFQKT